MNKPFDLILKKARGGNPVLRIFQLKKVYDVTNCKKEENRKQKSID
jgi:hypothetical protein